MLAFVSKRVAMALVIVLATIAIAFLLVHLVPGSPGQIILGPGASAAAIHAENAKLGWNAPLVNQFGHYLGQLLRGRLGYSVIDGSSVGSDLAARLPVTAGIALGATILSALVGIVAGVQAAVRGGFLDRAVTASAGLSISLPAFWVGILLVWLFAVKLHLLPATGYVSFATSPLQWARSLALPVLTLSIGAVAALARQTRSSMLAALGREHIRTLQALGTPRWRVRYIHALRSASVPVVSVLGLQFIGLFGSTIVIEQIFALPGLGQAAQTAIGNHDFPTVEALVIVSTIVVVLVNLVLDLVLLVLDPRVRTR
jgi:peptide/nickel transport system permease protein